MSSARTNAISSRTGSSLEERERPALLRRVAACGASGCGVRASWRRSAALGSSRLRRSPVRPSGSAAPAPCRRVGRGRRPRRPRAGSTGRRPSASPARSGSARPPSGAGGCGEPEPVPALADPGALPAALPQVVELGPAHAAPGEDLDLGDGRRVQREGALDADAEGDLADREGLAQPAALAPDDDALEHLDALAARLGHPHVHAHVSPGAEVRQVVAQARLLDQIGLFMDNGPGSLWEMARLPMIAPSVAHPGPVRPPDSAGSRPPAEQIRAVPAGLLQRPRPAATRRSRPWSPDSRTSGPPSPGTRAAACSAGGPAGPRLERLAVESDSALPTTPGTSRVTASRTTSAGTSPPDST